jgi:hypothetical protein
MRHRPYNVRRFPPLPRPAAAISRLASLSSALRRPWRDGTPATLREPVQADHALHLWMVVGSGLPRQHTHTHTHARERALVPGQALVSPAKATPLPCLSLGVGVSEWHRNHRPYSAALDGDTYLAHEAANVLLRVATWN